LIIPSATEIIEVHGPPLRRLLNAIGCQAALPMHLVRTPSRQRTVSYSWQLFSRNV
jgi:hypothetical protein